MPDDNQSFERTLREMGREIEKGAEKLHPITPSELEAAHAAVRRQFSERRKPDPQPNWWHSLIAVVRGYRSFIGYAAAAIIVLLGLAYNFWPGHDISLAALDAPVRVGFANLPRSASFNAKGRTLELVDGAARLSGTLLPLPQLSTPSLSVYTNNLHGADSVGAELWVRCTVWVTNAPGVKVVRQPADLVGILVDGSLEIPGRPGLPVRQSYVPRPLP